MTTGAAFNALPGRCYLFASGTQRYDHLPATAWLPSVATDIEAIVSLFCDGMGYERILPDISLDPTSQQVREALSSWTTNSDRRSDDSLVVYYSGHGAPAAKRHYLFTRDTVESNLHGTGLPADIFAWMLGDESVVRNGLIILDTCYAGAGIQDLGRAASALADVRPSSDLNSGLWFMAAARRADEAIEGAFVDSLLTVLRRHRAGRLQPYLSIDSIISEINNDLRAKNASQRARFGAVDSAGLAPFFPNRDFEPPQPDDVTGNRSPIRDAFSLDLTTHWIPRAGGIDTGDGYMWTFAGRTTALGTLATWLTEPDTDHRARVVTGAPGSGKSALLARLVTMSWIPTRTTMDLQNVNPATVIPRGRIDAAVVCRNRSVAEILQHFEERLHLPTSSAAEMIAGLRRRRRGHVIIIDALDEAQAPEDVLADLVAPLIQIASEIDLKLIVGVRHPLADTLGTRSVRIDLDDPEFYRADDVSGYVELLLEAYADRSGQSAVAEPAGRARLAGQVAQQAGRNFLVARILARSLASHPDVVRTDLPDTLAHSFDFYLETFGDQEKRARDLLTPLAWAEGNGLPSDNVWLAVVNELSSSSYNQADILWVRSQAAAFLVESESNGRSVYRLYHQALAECLRSGMDQDRTKTLICRALLSTVPDGGAGERDWFSAPPYVRANLAAHASGLSIIQELVEDAGFLLATDVDRLLAAVDQTDHLSSRLAAVYLAMSHHFHGQPVGVRASYLRMLALQFGLLDLANDVSSFEGIMPWKPLWAQWVSVRTHRVLTRSGAPATCLAAIRVQGAGLLSAGDDEGWLRIWNAQTGLLVAQVRVSPGSAVTQVCAMLDAGAVVVVTAAGDGMVSNYRLVEHDLVPIVRVGASSSPIIGLTKLVLDRQPCVVVGGVDGSISVRDARSLHQVLEFVTTRSEPSRRSVLAPRRRFQQQVAAITTFSRDGRGLVLSCHDDGTVSVHEAATGEQMERHKSPEFAGARVVTACSAEGQEGFAIGRDDGTLILFEASRLMPITTLAGGRQGITAVASTRSNGRELLAAGGPDGHVRLWSTPETGSGAPALAGHRARVAAMAFERARAAAVLYTAGADGTIRAWDSRWISAGGSSGTPSVVGRRAGALHPTADGTIAVIGRDDGRVEAVLLETGEPIRADMTLAHQLSVRAVCAMDRALGMFAASIASDETLIIWSLDGTHPHHSYALPCDNGGAPHAVVTRAGSASVLAYGGDAGTLRLWDLDAESVSYPPIAAHDGAVRGLAAGEIRGQPVLLSAGDDGLLRSWELVEDGLHLRNAFLVHESGISAIALYLLPGGQFGVMCAGRGGGLTRLDLETGIFRDVSWTSRPGAITTLAVNGKRDVPFVVAGGDFGVAFCTLNEPVTWRHLDVGATVDFVSVSDDNVCLVGTERGVMALDFRALEASDILWQGLPII